MIVDPAPYWSEISTLVYNVYVSDHYNGARLTCESFGCPTPVVHHLEKELRLRVSSVLK